MRIRVLALALLVLLLSASCSTYRYSNAEVYLRYLSKEDALLVLEVERGIVPNKAGRQEAESAASALTDALNGRRMYPAEGGILKVDYDDVDVSPKPEDEVEQAAKRQFAAELTVQEARLFIDAQSRLSFMRLSRLTHLHRVLELVNGWMNRKGLFSEDPAVAFESKYPVFDLATRDALRLAVGSGHAWLRLEGEAIVFDVPMTQSNAARCITWIRGAARDVDASQEQQWADQMTSIAIASDHVLLRFGEAPHRAVHFEWHEKPPDTSADELLQVLHEQAIRIGTVDDFERVRATLDLPLPQIRSK